MNNLIHHQATRDVLKSRFGSHKRLRCKTTLQYPVSVEREYQRITNACYGKGIQLVIQAR